MTLKGWGLEILLGGILTIKHFCYAEGDTWHRLIKINMTYVHMKPEVKKNEATAVAAVTNEACIGWLHEGCNFV